MSMTPARRARLAALRCDDKARRADERARAARTPQARYEWTDLADTYRTTAAEWRALLRDWDESLDAACEECGAADEEECSDGCECLECAVGRSLDADADAWAGR